MTSALVFVCASFLVGCAFGEGSPGDDTSGGVDAAVATGATCGDSVCAASEVGSCTQDCGNGGGGTGVNPVCGNSTCETGETSASCPNDCGGGGGSGSGSGTACPSDPNACLFCAFAGQMCPAGHDMNSCTACALGGGGLPGGGGGTCNNDGTCDAAEVTDPTCADCI